MSGIGLQWVRVGRTGKVERKCECDRQKMNDSVEARIQVLRSVLLFRGLSDAEGPRLVTSTSQVKSVPGIIGTAGS